MSRACSEAGCGTVLSVYNPDSRCRRHARERLFLVPRSLLTLSIPSWAYDGACTPHVTDEWFPETDGSVANESPAVARFALGTCGLCPVRRTCLEYAFTIEDGFRQYRQGIYGGVTGAERERYASDPDRIDKLLRLGDERLRTEDYRRTDGRRYLFEYPTPEEVADDRAARSSA